MRSFWQRAQRVDLIARVRVCECECVSSRRMVDGSMTALLAASLLSPHITTPRASEWTAGRVGALGASLSLLLAV